MDGENRIILNVGGIRWVIQFLIMLQLLKKHLLITYTNN